MTNVTVTVKPWEGPFRKAEIDYGDGHPVTVVDIEYEDAPIAATLACLRKLNAAGAITLTVTEYE
jgi:hypothetical protein